VVFDKAQGKPILHTEIQDLSAGGTAIHSKYADLTGSRVTLLLARPGRHAGEAPKMVKIGACVVSTVRRPGVSGFRHGLSFDRSEGDGLEDLADILGAEQSAQPGGEPIPASHSAATPAIQAAAAGGGRLVRLRQLALAKQPTGGKPGSQEQINGRVSAALERAFKYLKELADLLNILKPDYAKAYPVAGGPTFDGLKWEDGRIDFRCRDTSPRTKVCELVTLHFRLSADKQLRVTRDGPADERLRKLLLEFNIRFTSRQERNELGSGAQTTFVLPCQVEASLHLVGNFDTGKVLLRTLNIGNFSMLAYVLAPEAITEESLDELTGFILGESGGVGPLLLKNA